MRVFFAGGVPAAPAPVVKSPAEQTAAGQPATSAFLTSDSLWVTVLVAGPPILSLPLPAAAAPDI